MNENIMKESINNVNNNDKLKMILVGGTEAVTKNMTVYEYKDEIIVVDCGIGFPDIFDMPGVDVLLPDFSYLLQNSHKIKGLFITHGHEDHVGAVPYLLQELPDLNIYSTKLVQEIIKVKLEDVVSKESAKGVKFHLVDPEGDDISLGNFKIGAIRLNHSIPETVGYAIKTPQGQIFHFADYKIDNTPVLDKPIDMDKIKRYASEGALCLLSDALGVTTEGDTISEKTLEKTFVDLFKRAGNRQVFVTTMSSNISRMYQIIVAAIQEGRRVVPSGRSIEQMVKVARGLGYLPHEGDIFVEEKEASTFDQGSLVYVIAGCYGQSGSSLARLSRGEHEQITLEKDAMVIFSGDPNPPGADVMVGKVTDALTLSGAEVITSDIQDNLHVSGHGVRKDLMTIAEMIKPKNFIPIGGTITKMRAFTNMVGDLGMPKDSVLECLEGDVIEFSNGKGRKVDKIQINPVYLDSGSRTEINPKVIKDRGQLCTDGVFVVVVPMSPEGKIFSEKIDVITRGFIYVRDSKELMDKSKNFVSKRINRDIPKINDWSKYKKRLEYDVERFLRQKTSMKPMVIVHAITI